MKRICYDCKNYKERHCLINNHEILNGYAMIAHANNCKHYKKKK